MALFDIHKLSCGSYVHSLTSCDDASVVSVKNRHLQDGVTHALPILNSKLSSSQSGYQPTLESPVYYLTHNWRDKRRVQGYLCESERRARYTVTTL